MSPQHGPYLYGSGHESPVARPREVLEGGGRGRGGGGPGAQKFVCQKWPDQIFPMVNFICPHDGHFGLGGGV